MIRAIGSEQTKSSGYVFVKIAQPNVWKHRSRLVWEAANGPMQKGHLIHHENEIRDDDRLENLRYVTNGQHNRIHKRLLRPWEVIEKNRIEKVVVSHMPGQPGGQGVLYKPVEGT